MGIRTLQYCIKKIRTMVKIILCFILKKSILHRRFIDPVAQDVVSVKSFDGQWEVSTFRTIGRNHVLY
jgi:hypothetical protein